nr:autophagy-related protein 13-like [Ciona intestinalis]|eukprot:XP_002123340.3 autophagy-related protein 13-like [Ciona intestinalis]
MSSSNLSTQDKRDLDKFIKFLSLKSTQIIVQSRLGRKVSTKSVASPTGAEWFNLAVKDYPEIQKEAKAALNNGNPSVEQSLVVEISLRTSDADLLVLEVWSLSVTNRLEDVRVHHTIYNRMSLLLKSLLCVTRLTPAYKLSRNQGSEYVICYRVYMGQISQTGLGEGFQTLRVGSLGTPLGTITMSAAYRTNQNLHVSTKGLTPKIESVMPVKNDYFGNTARPHISSPARPCYTLKSRIRTMSETSETAIPSVESPPSCHLFNTSFSTSPVDYKHKGEHILDRSEQQATFTVGTPPRLTRASTSSPILVHRNKLYHPQNSPQSPPENRHQSFIKSKSRDPTIQKYGSSAPLMQVFYKHHTPPQPSVTAALEPQPPFQCSPDRQEKTAVHCYSTSQPTKYCHWTNSNVRTITAHNIPPSKGGEFSTDLQTTTHISPPHPQLVTGAFVSGKTAARAKAAIAEAEAKHLAFRDLLRTTPTDCPSEDNASQLSSSPESLAKEIIGKESKSLNSVPRRYSSSSSLSSKQSTDGSVAAKQNSDDYVMVDLNPAFARNDSSIDLGTFYRECENVPELIMFNEQHGTETNETLLDLTKQLEDYEQEMTDFDAFLQEINAAV